MRATHNRAGRDDSQRHAGGQGGAQASLPFDYSASVPITGQVGTVHESVINISPEGPFTAYGVSYGFEQNRGRTIGPFLPAGAPILPGDLTLGDFPIDVLVEGLRVGPRYLPMIFETRATSRGIDSRDASPKRRSCATF
jgi:hypothetical protein